ncbi:MAG: Hsp33 family molecular chaperone HslO [Candidatus Kapabacteria bacterium]|nr:Hsp33 family molecular chaperone HslO [Candidatus Kapabacteria bacterium]
MSDSVKKLWAQRDRVTRAITLDGTFRAAVIHNTTTTRTAQQKHGLDPMASLVLARALTGASLMASYLKGEERMVVSLEGDGLVRSVTAEAMQVGEVRGYITLNRNPDESRATPLGKGLLRVQRVLYGEYEPVMGIVELRRGDVTSDLGYYLTQSEQVPSAFVIDVAYDEHDVIRQSIGLLVQAMPGARPEDIFKLYDAIDYLGRLSEFADSGYSPHDILQQIMPSEIEVVASSPVDFFCRCSHERFTSALMTLDTSEIIQMREEGHRELVCQYCSTKYELRDEDFDRLINRS